MRKLLTCALLALTLCVQAGVPTNIRVKAVLTPSGKVDTRYRNGDDGSAAVPLTWASIPTIAGVQGTPQTVNLRTLYFTEPGSPNATFTYSAGCTGGGWTTGTDGLSYTYSSAYSGTCQVTGTRSGKAASSNVFNLTSTTSASADATAPSQVLGAAAVQIANGIRITGYPSSDPKVAGENWSGLADYKLYRDGSGTALATLSAPGTGLQVQLAGTELGGSTGGSVSQTGNTYSVVSAGDGIGGTQEVGYFAHQTVSGDFQLCGDFHSITGGNTNAHIAFMARSSLVGSDPATFLRKIPANFRVRGRGTAGASAQQYGATIAITGPAYGCFARSGTSWSSTYSATGNAFGVVDTSMPTSLPTQIEVGVFVGTGSSTPTTGEVRELTLSQQPSLTYDDPIADGASHSYVWKARDGAGNLATASLSVSATAPSTSDSTAPSSPTNLTGGTSAIQTTVSWTWTACTDASGIRGYTPSISTTQNGTYTDQAEQVGTTFNYSTGITAGTTRWLKVKCTDNAGNASSFATAVSATSAAAPPADTTAPTVPGGACTFNSLTGPCAIPQSTTVLRITTTGSTDTGGCGVSDYRLYRASSSGGPFNLVGAFTTTTFDYDTGGPPNTQTFYKMTARDCASPQNESAQSNTFTGTTLSGTGGTLLLTETFTSTTLNTGRWHTSTDNGATRTISAGTSPCSSPRDSPYSITHTTDGTQDSAAHAEIVPNFSFQVGKSYWMGESICIGDPNVATLGWYFLTQMHGVAGTSNPVMSLGTDGATGNWRIQILADTNSTFQTPYERNTRIVCNGTDAPVAPVQLGVWTDIVLHFRFGGGTINGTYFGNTNPGFWQVWIKNASGTYVKCIDDVGMNYLVSDETANSGPYLKLGQYKGYDLTNEPSITTRKVSHDEIRIGLESDGIGFADVEPR